MQPDFQRLKLVKKFSIAQICKKTYSGYTIEFFHNSHLIRRIEQEKITKNERLDQELNPDHLLRS